MYRARPPKRSYADDAAGWVRPGTEQAHQTSPAPKRRATRQGGFSPTQAPLSEIRMRQTEDALVRLQTENQKLKDENNLLKTQAEHNQRELKQL
eukprot:SAG11_NODE_4909_length_1725_cov_4.039360_2_plen_94_part_00